ncbi:MAG: Mu transposase C-terminal domain-containing protein [Nostoc sp. DedVER02]|uniref:Mu transposase C-terminal domain-containing protein n=1 Tax=unclassified Nostoc TaxID=2593658 RepID=UPI002AD543A1|nr:MULTISPECIES: Mu transposase C-terminal domain-containing protein [unclassified Nostoc]MDZ7990259.1 DDE-type integrase/transposase/recombinase [Nostoc sp. DedVER02]MDZ8116741.1 DDE-type integrase/transposase/recombinase [Nostoc sp. DedVER01b]
MSLLVNMLLEWQNAEAENKIERVLWIDPSGQDMVTIEINNSKALPKWQKFKEVETAIISKKMCILEVDPYSGLLRPESAISENHRQRRDHAWNVIAPLVEGEIELIFDARTRGQLIRDTVKRTGCIKKTIYHYLRRYWQGGQAKNTLLPLFDRCGAKGKEKKPSNCKRGRPSKLSKVTNIPLGINVDDEIRHSFQRGIKLFYEKQQGITLNNAFDETLKKFFHKGYEIRDKVLVPVLPPASELPTFAQFRYWYDKERDISREKISREGQRRFNLSYRAILGNSTQMAYGPGSVYQIDATIGDIYLVSSLDRNRIIGRPVIYFIIDTFSRLITGFSVSLEGPSWLGAMLALENATKDKVAFCQEYGIQIDEADWPSHHLPEKILADRGELEGYNADNLVNALDIGISNTPPYRADWKAIVERNFRLSNDKMIHWMPGAVYQKRERGDKDYRLDAVLDLNQFRKLMIYCVLDHNKDHRMQWYRMDEFMIQDYVDPYPLDVWNWGIRNRVGHLRQMASEIVKLNLLPTAEASVTAQGIYYKGLLYTCQLALREQWFVKARIKGRWKVPIAYDIRSLNTIYLRLDDSRHLEPCELIETETTFRGRNWYETVDYFELQKQGKEIAMTRQQSSKATFQAQVDQILGEAKEQTEKALTGQSKRSRTKNIRENRKSERESERETGAWELGAKENSQELGQVIPIPLNTQPEEENEGYVAPPKSIDKLRKLRERNWKND